MAEAQRKYFGTDGVRGTANQFPLDPETLVRLGKAIARLFLRRKGKHRILIGKDTRLSGYMIETSLAAGISCMGADVLLSGPIPTPGVAYLTRSMRADAGIVISASHNPYEDNGIKIFGADGLKLADDMELELTTKGIETLLPEITAELEESLKERFKTLPPNAIDPKKIKPATLLFNPDLDAQVRDLHRLIKPAKFKEFKRKMPSQGRMTGLTILFHGDPGTGKTELALQLARQTGRAVFRLDVTHIMSKWVGDSEKNLKSFFHDYAKALQYITPEPILLLNECDGLLTRRMAVNSSVDQMNNALQNILLESLENFDGILIATTNMTRNLDDAFERRFLYKIKFELPESAVALNIWKQAVPSLKTHEAEWLSNRYRLSAAEIYNIARKLAVQSLLNKNTHEFDLICRLCDSEKWSHQSSHFLGFS